MPSIINNQGESCGVQQPKLQRRIHSAHHQWKKQQWENIMKTKDGSASNTGPTSHWPLVNQTQQEWLNAKRLQDSGLSPSAVSNPMLSLSQRVAAMVPTSPHTCVVAGGPPPNPHVENTETIKTQNGSAGHAPNLFSAGLDSSLSNLRYTMRIAAATFGRTPSIFRKRKRERFSAKGSGENDSYRQVEKPHSGAGNYGGKAEPELLNLFQLEPDLETMKENPQKEQLSPSDVMLSREGGHLQLGLYAHSVVLLGDQGGGYLHKDTTTTDTTTAVQNPLERPPKLSIVSSEAFAKDAIDSACSQSLSKSPLSPHVTLLSGNGQSLDSARKLISSDLWSVYMDKELSISAVEILNGSASTSSSQGASRGVSYSTHATLSRAASNKNVSPCATPSTAASKKGSPSSRATPSTAASKKVLHSSSATPSTASKKASPSSSATPSMAASKKVLHSSIATPSTASKKASPSSSATPSMAASKKVLHSSSATPCTTARRISPSSSPTPSGQISTQSPETLLQQKIRPNVSKQFCNQNKGTPKQKGLASNQTRSLSQLGRSSDVDTKLPAVPEGNIKSIFKGVGYFKRTKRWEAHIWNAEESKQEYLGAFSTEEQAARAYDRATIFFRGVNAKLNFKLEDYKEELPRLEALTKDQLTTMLKKQSKGRGSLNPAYPA